jgi:NAD-dependent dihydropyrimidine dehydrogenase PreA subunit
VTATPAGRHQEAAVAYVIAEPCIDNMDQSCVAVCPVDCIAAGPGDRKLYIDPDACIDCGACERACPNSAIFRADQLPPAWAAYAAVDAGWYRDPTAIRGRLEQLLAS